MQIAIPGWILMFAAICLMSVIARLASAGKLGVVVAVVLAMGAGLFSLVSLRSGPAPKSITVSSSYGSVEILMPPQASPPRRVQRAPKAPAAPTNVAQAAPPAPAAAERPPEPPMAITLAAPEPMAPTPAAPPAAEAPSVPGEVKVDAPLTLFIGQSVVGQAVDKLPEWTNQSTKGLEGDLLVLRSERFASIAEAEKELWTRARSEVAREFTTRLTQAAGWLPSEQLLKSRGFILERCIERTELKVGGFAEPMYRVYWKARLSNDLRAAVADAWRPTVQSRYVESVAAFFLGTTTLLAVLNFLLRSLAARWAVRKPALPTA